MKFLILGCNGMAGHLIALYLKENGHDVIGFARKESRSVSTIVGDARDQKLLKQIVKSGNYDSIINCVGILNQFAETDHEAAVYLNGYLPHYLAKITENSSTQVICLSTDCVFSGKTGSYTEDSLRDGETFYDRSKAIGEIEDDKNVTLRCSIVGPDLNKDGIGLLNWFLQQKETVKGYTHAIWTGQTTLQLAKTIEEASKQRVSGLVHAVPNESISKYALLRLFNERIRTNKILIIPDSDYKIDKSLIRNNLKTFRYEIPAYEQMVEELRDWMMAHKELYPHYNI